ncbi:DNA-binding response regulator, LuxR family [Caballeronia sordidicola]|uniref:DNA-binding response regulator, LuxR family n=2 Tax=Burkholderiales TaxID=80840 RepID=A0A242MS64_CABSO|nr:MULTISPECIES: response regulator transcription factor [Burkholderiaceae]AMH43259.1 LuxR family transcriptional regulator [Burkholderia sp. PAMC 26561]OTP74180.1 DNA-binding response regulator, LuxR family [Caballeronia sordidicola]
MTGTIDILLVDDHQLVRDGLRLRLDAIDGFRVVGEASNMPEALRVMERLSPRLVLTDLSMKGGSGVALTRAIRQRHPAMHVLVLSMHNNAEYMAEARAAGASGYVLKDAPATEIIAAIHTILGGGAYFNEQVKQAAAVPVKSHAKDRSNYRQIEKLTPREQELLRDLANGLSNKQIAVLHGLSVRTVETHRMSIKRKLDIEGQAELIKFAVEFFSA